MRTIYHTDWGSVISEKQILQNTRQEGLIVFHLLFNCLFSSHFLQFATLRDAYNLKHLFKELRLDPSVSGSNPAVPPDHSFFNSHRRLVCAKNRFLVRQVPIFGNLIREFPNEKTGNNTQ